MAATDVLYVRLPAETMAEIRRQAKELGLPISTFPELRVRARQELAHRLFGTSGRP